MAEAGEHPPGLLAAFKGLLKTGVAIAANRFELLLVELQEERLELFQTLLLGGIVLLFAFLTFTLATFIVVVLCLKANRIDLLVALGLFYLIVTLIAFWRLRVRLKKSAPFSGTLAELRKDQACLEEKKPTNSVSESRS